MELRTRMLVMIPEPTHIQDILDWHTRKFQLQNKTNSRLQYSRRHVLDLLASAVTANNPYSILKIAELENKIEGSDLTIKEPLQIIFPEMKGTSTTSIGGATKTGRIIYKSI